MPAINLRHRDCGYQLILNSQQHRSPDKFVKTAAETGLAKDIGQRHRLSRIRNGAALHFGGEVFAQC